jgi:hypothetical protein
MEQNLYRVQECTAARIATHAKAGTQELQHIVEQKFIFTLLLIIYW